MRLIGINAGVYIRNPRRIALAKVFFIKFPKLADLTTRHGLENGLVIRRVLHQLVNFLYNAFAISLSQPLQKYAVVS